METLSIIIITFIAITFAQLIWDLIIEFFKIFKIFTGSYKNKEMSNTYVTLDEFYSEDRNAIKQVVYKVEGDFNGNISSDNVTVILMGDGNINGDVKSKDGNVVLIKGNINGDVKANKIVCPDDCKKNEEKKKDEKKITIRPYTVHLPLYTKQTGYINIPIYIEVTNNGDVIQIRQLKE